MNASLEMFSGRGYQNRIQYISAVYPFSMKQTEKSKVPVTGECAKLQYKEEAVRIS